MNSTNSIATSLGTQSPPLQGWGLDRASDPTAKAVGFAPGFKHTGIGLIELLVALSISAALLGATAVAIDASFKSYAVNQEQADLTQRCRLVMHRVLTFIRTTKAHQPVTASKIAQFTTGAITSDTGISMFRDDGTILEFSYDATNKRVILTEGANSAILLDGVTQFQINFEPMKSATAIKTGSGSYDLLMRATVLLSVQSNSHTAGTGETSGAQVVTFSSSVMPRRNIW